MKDNLVEWGEEMLIPIELPASNDEIVFKLYDYDPTFDDIVASFKFSIKDIVKKCKNNQKAGEDRGYQMQWVNLYGCNPDKDNAEAKK